MYDNIITISGSMKFYEDMIKVGEELSMNGNVVLIPFKDLNEDNMTNEAKKMHEELHKQRIDMSDRLFVINKDGYIGKSTKNEILYAINTKNSKPVVFMEPVQLNQWKDILSAIPLDSLIQCIRPTLQYMIEDLMRSIIKYESLHEKGKCNFIEAGTEINRYQKLVQFLIESMIEILKPTVITFWPYCYEIKSDACINVIKSMDDEIKDFKRIVNRSIESLMYLTPSELITCDIEW